jgi:SHS2 domain-containing protein
VKDPGRHRPFRELDHTADLRVEILGKDEQDLFRNAIESLYVLLGLPVVGSDGSDPGPAEDLEILGRDPEEALVELLGEILYRATVEGMRINLREISARAGEKGTGGCRVVVSGTWCDLRPEELAGLREIKAVTYHDLEIRQTPKGLVARVVMDI